MTGRRRVVKCSAGNRRWEHPQRPHVSNSVPPGAGAPGYGRFRDRGGRGNESSSLRVHKIVESPDIARGRFGFENTAPAARATEMPAGIPTTIQWPTSPHSAPITAPAAAPTRAPRASINPTLRRSSRLGPCARFGLLPSPESPGCEEADVGSRWSRSEAGVSRLTLAPADPPASLDMTERLAGGCYEHMPGVLPGRKNSAAPRPAGFGPGCPTRLRRQRERLRLRHVFGSEPHPV